MIFGVCLVVVVVVVVVVVDVFDLVGTWQRTDGCGVCFGV